MDENKTTPAATESGTVQLDAAYVIMKIDQIMADSATLHKALELLENQSIGDEAVMGISNMIEARERTHQAMIDLLKSVIAEKKL